MGEGWDLLEKLGKERNEERRLFVFFFVVWVNVFFVLMDEW